MKKPLISFVVLLGMSLIFLSFKGYFAGDQDWPEYLGGADRNHYSSLTQINTGNVTALEPVWEYHTGDSGQVQCNPIIVGGRMFAITASNHLFALDAASGRELWRFAPEKKGPSNVNRGIAYWEKGKDKRILFAHLTWLYAINPSTGKPIPSFGEGGRVSLKSGLGEDAASEFVSSTTPGTIYGDLIVMPMRLGEGTGSAPGYIQAFNIRTGKIAWVFKTIPLPGERGYETWPADAYKNPAIGAANNWAGMAVDRKRGIIYIPTGSASFDFYGGNRKGENLYANSLLALNAKTGEYIWHFQTVHHDIWDRDLPAPPNLITIKKDGKSIDAVAQVTKSGHVFVFDRVNGTPLFPIDELPFPQSTLPGEEAWPTQPVPRLPKPFARQTITENDITRFSAKRDSLLTIYRNANKGAFHPLDFKQTIIFPGPDGAAEWGGAAVDKDGIMYVNSNEMAWLFSLSKKSIPSAVASTGKSLYLNNCQSCHKSDFSGNPQSGYPALVGIRERLGRTVTSNLIKSGKGMMPGFSQISDQERQAIISYIFGEEKDEILPVAKDEYPDVPYQFNGYNKFLDEKGYPAITPPWGTLTAINLNTGQHLWQIPLGELKELSKKGIPVTGTENYGGPLVTAGGLLFIAATKDNTFRAIDKKTGKILWEHPLPASGFATPSTYQLNGKQYIVIACGGTKLGMSKGDSYVAFALGNL
ncbi:quinoprotein glucose dehydrogenase [Daejeonella rubra]|uniref:Quinoprotein glucose dehydrogenase n=1 Tax=Daejeonella rubra TaxID=990371 RepID=A0A1G9LRL8_9SPHI|nr:PQQ-binding-like beta-propeller repeat protein [Daejeonella rubra]SDL64702.1 quinoprotein glucose dehydrogenase [Daejeonella rubra]